MEKNKSFMIQLAGKNIYISPLYEMVREYCKEYIIEDFHTDTKWVSSEEKDISGADFIVQISKEDIAGERMRSEKEAVLEGQNAAVYSEAYLETLAVYRKIAEWVPMQSILLFHGSVIAVDGKAYLFTAKSGTGKSTHTRLWREYFGDRAVMVNDDKPLIRITEDGVYVYGTPWNGKHRLSNNIHAVLAGICILKRAEENVIQKITFHDAYPMLLQQCYRPGNTKALMATMQLLDRLKEQMDFYELFCNISREAVEVAYHGMKGNEI